MNINELNKLDIKKIQAQIQPIMKKIQRYSVVIFIFVLFLMYSFLILKINSLSSKEPDESEVSQQLLTVKRLKVDQSAVDSIQKLQDNSSDVRTLFKNARSNPFHE